MLETRWHLWTSPEAQKSHNVFIPDRKDEPSAAARKCSATGYWHAEQMADRKRTPACSRNLDVMLMYHSGNIGRTIPQQHRRAVPWSFGDKLLNEICKVSAARSLIYAYMLSCMQSDEVVQSNATVPPQLNAACIHTQPILTFIMFVMWLSLMLICISSWPIIWSPRGDD